MRKRTIVKSPTIIKIVVNPSKRQATNLNNLKKHQTQQIQIRQPAAISNPQIPQNAAVSKQHLINNKVNKQSKIKYITRDISPESIPKIKQLKNHGNNKILIIIGNGPSINEIPLEQLKDNQHIHTLSINKPDSRLWPTTAWAFFDQSQLRRNEDLWNGYDGIIFNSTAIKRQKNNSIQIKNLGGKGFSKDLSKGLHIGRSSVFAAMQIGCWMGYDHIYIVGVDMNPQTQGPLHFYGTNPDVDPNIRKDRFKKEAEYYDYAADLLNGEERNKFTFCSSENPWEFVNKFNKLDHKIAIDKILEHVHRNYFV